nr:glucose-1-phosphate adenylyltransferase [Herpetosiphonaceae bacterium]
GMVTTDGDGRVTRFEEKPRRTNSTLASMGIYAFRKQYLVDLLTADNAADFGREMLPRIVGDAHVTASLFNGYWADVGTLQSFYESNMALLAEAPALDLYDPEWVVRTRSEERPAAQLGVTARIERSLLCDGCRIDGQISGSLIGTGVTVGAGAIVRDSIIMPDSVIAPGAIIDRCIIDKDVVVGANTRLGDGPAATANATLPQLLNTGLTVVGKAARIADNCTIGRNVIINARANVTNDVSGGGTV